MAFDEWKRLVLAQVSISEVDGAWLQREYSSGTSPLQVSELIRGGKAPARPIGERYHQHQRSIFSSGSYFCATLVIWCGWSLVAVSLTSLLLTLFGSLFVSSQASHEIQQTWTFFIFSGVSIVYAATAALTMAGIGSLFVLAGAYARNHMKQFE